MAFVVSRGDGSTTRNQLTPASNHFVRRRVLPFAQQSAREAGGEILIVPQNHQNLIFVLLGSPAYAPESVKADSQAPSVEELQQQIVKRDATIVDLVRRVEALEQTLPAAKPADQPEKTPKDASATASGTDPADEEISRALEPTLVQEGARCPQVAPTGPGSSDRNTGRKLKSVGAALSICGDRLIHSAIARDNSRQGLPYG